MSNALLTGLPRSGTTISCELLNKLPDTVALDEPMPRRQLMGFPPPSLLERVAHRLGSHRSPAVSRGAAARNIGEFLASTRRSLLEEGVATSKHVDGQVFGGKVADSTTSDGLRQRLAAKGSIQIAKKLEPDFTLVVKHNASFTALLDELVDHRVYAIVRNPLATLLSWQSVPFPIRDGHVPYGENLDPTLAAGLAALDDPVERQLHVLGWFFGRFDTLLPKEAVVRYEDVVSSGGQALAVVTPAAANLGEPLENRNRAAATPETRELAARLLDRDGAHWNFYSRESVEALVAESEIR